MWWWEEMQEGVRAACCWLGQFFHSHRTPCCVIAKSLTRSISYLCSLCFLPGCLWRYLAEMVASFFKYFPIPFSFGASLALGAPRSFPCPSLSPPASSRTLCSSHTSAHRKEMIFWDGIRPRCLIHGAETVVIPGRMGLFRVGERHQLRMSPSLGLICFKQ